VALGARGDGGFGYDPIFEPATEPVGGRTVAQITQEEKNRVSHRAQAALAMRKLLIARGY
jgi:XTP/dITP diphosphohydrolase